MVDFGLKVEVFKSVYRKRFNRNSVVCKWVVYMCVMNIILHTLLLVDVCENNNDFYTTLHCKKSY